VSTEERWRASVARVLTAVAEVIAEVDRQRPRTRYSLHKRLWWRFVGVPADVKDTQLRERRDRAALFLDVMHARKGEFANTARPPANHP
jgi:hypothetical protein